VPDAPWFRDDETYRYFLRYLRNPNGLKVKGHRSKVLRKARALDGPEALAAFIQKLMDKEMEGLDKPGRREKPASDTGSKVSKTGKETAFGIDDLANTENPGATRGAAEALTHRSDEIRQFRHGMKRELWKIMPEDIRKNLTVTKFGKLTWEDVWARLEASGVDTTPLQKELELIEGDPYTRLPDKAKARMAKGEEIIRKKLRYPQELKSVIGKALGGATIADDERQMIREISQSLDDEAQAAANASEGRAGAKVVTEAGEEVVEEGTDILKRKRVPRPRAVGSKGTALLNMLGLPTGAATGKSTAWKAFTSGRTMPTLGAQLSGTYGASNLLAGNMAKGLAGTAASIPGLMLIEHLLSGFIGSVGDRVEEGIRRRGMSVPSADSMMTQVKAEEIRLRRQQEMLQRDPEAMARLAKQQTMEEARRTGRLPGEIFVGGEMDYGLGGMGGMGY
jgi:hypothetical protein